MVVINKGYKGQVMEIYNKNKKDINTLYNELTINENPRELKLIIINENGKKNYIKITKTEEINKILELLKETKDTLVKKFIYINYLYGTKKHNFNNELLGYKKLIKIFKSDINKYTTIKPGFIYNKEKIYGIIYNEDYYIFLERCYKILEDIKFTEESLNKCINDIIEILNIFNANNYIHNDLKPNNIILCKNRFKIIDWESSGEINKQPTNIINTRNGNIIYNHPIKFYNLGVPLFIYNYIYNININNHKYLKGLKIPLKIIENVNISFDKVLDKYNKIKKNKSEKKIKKNSMTIDEIEENKNYYMKLLDYYSFAISIIILAEKNKIKYNKKIINNILSKFFIDIK